MKTLRPISAGQPPTPVIFIRGIMPRSGTNFLADALDRHESIVRSPGQFWEYVPFRFQQTLRQYVEQVGSSKHAHEFQPQDFLPHVGQAWLGFLAGELGEGQVALFKEPSVDDLESMFRMYEHGRAIIILRDGRDIVASALKSDFAFPKFQWWNRSHMRRLIPGEDFRIMCRKYAHAAETLLKFTEGEFGKTLSHRFKIVKYEAILRDPREQLTEIFEWANLDPQRYDWEAFDQMPIRGSSFLRGDDGNHDFGAGVSTPVRGFSPTGRWESWSLKRQSYFQRVAGNLARKLGYEQPTAITNGHAR